MNLSFNNVRLYQIILIVSAVLLIIWQVTLISGTDSSAETADATLLTFTLNDGDTQTLPDTNRYSVVIFWKAASERSVRLVQEAATICHEPEYDTLVSFYFVNLFDSLADARSAVDFDNPDLPFAHSPHGSFLDQNPVRSLPLTVVFSADGDVVESVEGYQEGSIRKLLVSLEMRSRVTGKHGEFRFDFGRESGQ